MKPFKVVIYGRPDCCLCDRAAADLDALRQEWPFVLSKQNIEDDAALKQKLRCQIPVVTIDGGNRVALRVTPERLRRAFANAARRRANS